MKERRRRKVMGKHLFLRNEWKMTAMQRKKTLKMKERKN